MDFLIKLVVEMLESKVTFPYMVATVCVVSTPVSAIFAWEKDLCSYRFHRHFFSQVNDHEAAAVWPLCKYNSHNFLLLFAWIALIL